MNCFRSFLIIILSLTFIVTACSTPSSSAELHIQTAASLTEAFTELKETYEANHENITLVPNFGSSGTLKHQIEQGAPADLFLSAAAKEMNDLEEQGLIKKQQPLLRNKLVLITHKDSDFERADLQILLDDKITRIAIGQPETVPAGQYAMETLKTLHLWDELQPKLIFGNDVRQVLTYTETKNVDAAFVYQTDAVASETVDIIAEAPSDSHEPIIYPIGLLQQSTNPEEAEAFYEWLTSDEALEILQKYGFEGA
ncbi:molybdate ABC transporter substrate-binding protein [Halalkalibacterium ligniniphilum]|uniref:molybdate ABC transporter substrate-binding protein n=1 Tax=Halalkalibacterium ligniniphilum TaxID=1134413 RepID=UPI000347FEF4|nr:molybdate ABC transporter substrate-binding protein [Halalkalibacterium ligniniphilum]